MIITKLNIISFGKFSNTVLDFKDGLNIIFGNNEAGKSTVSDFIYAMLYGFGDKRGQGVSLREKYIPWDGVCMEGAITLENGGKTYTVYRKSGLTKKHDILKIYDEDGIEKPCAVSDIFPVSEAVFFKALSVRQAKSAVGAPDASLTQRLSNLSSGGEEEVCAEKAIKLLTDICGEIKSKRGRRGRLYDIEDEIQRITEGAKESERLKSALYTAERERDSRARALSLAQENYGSFKPEKYGEERARICGILEEKQKTLDALTKDIPNNTEVAPFTKKPAAAMFAFIICIIFAALSFVFAFFLPLSAAGLIVSVRQYTRYLRKKKEAASQIQKDRQRAEDTKRRADILKSEISSLKEKSDRLLSLSAENEKKQKALSEALDDARNKYFLAENAFSEAQRNAETAPEESPEELFCERERLVFSLSCAQSALDALLYTFDEMKRNFTPALNRIASEYFFALTCEKYSRLLADREFNLSVDTGVLRRGELFSGGTEDQMYLSLRLALADMLFEDEKIFLLLDEPFFQYDAARTAAANALLSSLAQKRQTLLFTSDARVLECKNANILKL